MGWCRAQIHLLIHVIAVFHTLHAGVYYEGANEAAISHRCHPELSSCFPSQLEWARLEAKMTGTLVWPDDSFNYTTYNQQFNLGFLTYPIVHVVCKTADDIQNAIRFAKAHNLRVTIKSTGHDTWGRSSAHSSFSINLMEMKQISLDIAATERSKHGEITVQTGATYGEIYAEVEKHGRVVVGGNSPLPGPGGLIAGGGYGPVTPSLGLAVDNVLEIKIVLADGRVATCTQNKTVIEHNGISETRNNGDLFWALRGGGGGTFGVVVHYVLKLHPAQRSIVRAMITVPLYQNDSDIPLTKLFLEKGAEWLNTAPFHWGGSFFIHSTMAIATLTKNSPFDENTESELQPFYDLKSLYPTQSMINITVSNHPSISSTIFPEMAQMRGYVAGALITAEKNNESLWSFVVDEMIDNDNGYCIFSRLGGNVWNYNKAWSSVHASFRRVQFLLSCTFVNLSWVSNQQEISTFEDQERHKMNVARFAKNVRKFGDGNYVNSAYAPSPDWKVDFWGDNYVDLLKVKIKYDPDNLFYCHHCVGSDMKMKVDESSGAPTNVSKRLSVLLLLLLTIFMGFM